MNLEDYKLYLASRAAFEDTLKPVVARRLNQIRRIHNLTGRTSTNIVCVHDRFYFEDRSITVGGTDYWSYGGSEDYSAEIGTSEALMNSSEWITHIKKYFRDSLALDIKRKTRLEEIQDLEDRRASLENRLAELYSKDVAV